MAGIEFIFKPPDGPPERIGLNIGTDLLRLQDVSEVHVVKKPGDPFSLPELASHDCPDSFFKKIKQDLILVRPGPDGSLVTYHFVPLGFFGLYRSAQRAILYRACAGTCPEFDLPFNTSDLILQSNLNFADIIKNALAKSAQVAQIAGGQLSCRRAFLWLHPGRGTQFLIVTAENQIVWCSLDISTSIKDASPPNGRFEEHMDGITWTVKFHYQGMPATTSTTLQCVAPGPHGSMRSFHCTVGGSDKCTIWHRVHEDNGWPLIKDWAVCAVRIC